MTNRVMVGKSKIHGNGVFAKKNFKKGDTVFILKGSLKKLKIRSKKDSDKGPNWVGISKELWLDPKTPFNYLNHSCDPNMGIKGRVTFVALRNIKKNEEVTFDYSTTEDDTYWEFKCKCGSKICRHHLRSIQYLPNNIYKKYLPFIPKYFQKAYNISNK